MIIPIELFAIALGVIAMIVAIGFWRFHREGSVVIVLAGVILFYMVMVTDSITMESFSSGDVDNSYVYNIESRTGSQVIRTGGAEIRGEYISSTSSQLYLQEFDCIDVWIQKTGSPTGTITIGVFNGIETTEALQLKKSFGTIEASDLTTAFIPHTFCLTDETYTTTLNDVIGVSYRDGNATNLIQIQTDTTNPYDGTITFSRRWDDPTQTWLSATIEDITERMYLRGEGLTITDNSFIFDTEIKILFALLASIICVMGAMMHVRKIESGDKD